MKSEDENERSIAASPGDARPPEASGLNAVRVARGRRARSVGIIGLCRVDGYDVVHWSGRAERGVAVHMTS